MVSGTSVTSLTRGIDPATGTSSNSLLKFAHRVGSDIKITDFPLLQILRNQANGADTYEHVLTYATGVTPANTGDLTDKEYVDGVAFSGAGVIDATSIAKGVVELATQTETASSSSAGSSGNLVIPASAATSTYNSATAASRVVVTQNSGKIDNNFLSTSTLFATSSIASGPIGMVGKNVQVFTSTGTSTFAVPNGITKVWAMLCAGGGGGNSQRAGGGGGGGCAEKIVDLTGTTTVQVFVGSGGAGGILAAAGTWSTFGTNGFYFYATPGAGGSGTSGTTVSGGTGVNGDINYPGGYGGENIDLTTDKGGDGGDSHLGMGGAGTDNGTANNGLNYGGGGGGSSNSASGAQGIVIVRW
jgi:hypothetical protein